MQSQIRSPWAIILALTLLFGGLLFAYQTASSQTATPTPTTPPTAIVTLTPLAQTPAPVSQLPRTVTVTGNGSVEGQPDTAVILMGVRTEDEIAAQALEQNNTQMQALLNALRAAGVAQADMRTLSIQLQPRYQPPPSTRPNDPFSVSGFIASNLLEVTVRDLDNLGALIDSAVEAGGNQVEGIRFEISDSAILLDQARQAAMQDARHKAEQLSSLAGARLGVVVTINESSSRPYPLMRDLSQSSVGGEMPISPGTQSIQVDIEITWELQ